MALQSEVDRRFRETHVLIEGLETKIETVAEGVSANCEAHQQLRVEMGRRFDDIESLLRLPVAEIGSRSP